jgi:hypothetical protein
MRPPPVVTDKVDYENPQDLELLLKVLGALPGLVFQDGLLWGRGVTGPTGYHRHHGSAHL